MVKFKIIFNSIKMSCKKWKLSPFKDPKTGKDISEKRNKEMKQKCKSDKYNHEDCIFFELTSLNPKTMRKITSKVSKSKIKKQCDSGKRKQLTLEEVCKKWKKDPFVNPRTGRKLSGEKSQVYKSLKKECEQFKVKKSPKKVTSNKKEEKMKRDLIPFQKVEKKLKQLESELEDLETENQLDRWELKLEKVAQKRRLLLGNTLELDELKKKYQRKISKLYQLFEKKVYEVDKKNRKK